MSFAKSLDIGPPSDPDFVCPVCLQDKVDVAVTMPGCIHRLCVPCFRLLHGIKVPGVDVRVVQELPDEGSDYDYDDDDDDSQDGSDGDDDDEDYVGSPRCPMCRKSYVPDYMRKHRAEQ
ncbi:RING-type domain-containing protein [Plasmodiophora brassicae]|uniref:RING-type domain-containing protein n=1 Tax=Plasmodiophora brassicae TaxID=37360 RepID=A0A0G4J182_PLABS|nr:hypothetical protein PBRA_001926 [Plasmodiophora brassicae]